MYSRQMPAHFITLFTRDSGVDVLDFWDLAISSEEK